MGNRELFILSQEIHLVYDVIQTGSPNIPAGTYFGGRPGSLAGSVVLEDLERMSPVVVKVMVYIGRTWPTTRSSGRSKRKLNISFIIPGFETREIEPGMQRAGHLLEVHVLVDRIVNAGRDVGLDSIGFKSRHARNLAESGAAISELDGSKAVRDIHEGVLNCLALLFHSAQLVPQDLTRVSCVANLDSRVLPDRCSSDSSAESRCSCRQGTGTNRADRFNPAGCSEHMYIDSSSDDQQREHWPSTDLSWSTFPEPRRSTGRRSNRGWIPSPVLLR